MEIFSLQTENGEYNVCRQPLPKEVGSIGKTDFKLTILYKRESVRGEFILPSNWGATRIMQFIEGIDFVI